MKIQIIWINTFFIPLVDLGLAIKSYIGLDKILYNCAIENNIDLFVKERVSEYI